MRTTLTLDADVVAEVQRLRREEGIGMSEAINRLIRERLAAAEPARTYVHESYDLGLRIDVSNIGEVLDVLDADVP